MKRLPSIDIARGLVMVIMALDHARDLLHIHANQSPTNLATTTPILFFTRWITHLCAPAFVFLAGISAYLYLYSKPAAAGVDPPGGPGSRPGSPADRGSRRGAGSPGGVVSPAEMRSRRRFLLSRGIVLVLLEFTIVNFGMFFDTKFRLLIFEVIATIGTGMILLSFLSRLPLKAVVAIAAVLIFCHDLFNPAALPATGPVRFIVSLLLGLNVFTLSADRLFLVAYPILPWLGILLAGYAAGRLFAVPEQQRKVVFLRLGIAALALFVLLRSINVYGDPGAWAAQKDGVFTFLSYINVSKYPPSLLFTLVTLGILLLVLSVVEGRDNRAMRFLRVYGQAPMFYFVVHFYLLHTVMLAMVLLQGHHWADLPFGGGQFGRPAGAGLSLAAVYAIWVIVVIFMYPLCQWYGTYKQQHREKKWLRYL
ncbi:MAG TPA: heparan-alpha-glucosaminide N-acetyltransferase domain-containing protein [Puia sp.]|nr:heparan-alpha-glucosaminide N-acetyltransferase domain-containing protein [Puia sp.]